MKIYLKTGQTIDLGDVKYAWTDSEDDKLMPWKYCGDFEKLISIGNFANEGEYIIFVTDKQEFECKTHDIVGILYEVE